MKKFGIVDVTNFKSYENMFNEMSSRGFEYKESKFLNMIHYFNEKNEENNYKFVLDSENVMGNDFKDKINGFKVFESNEKVLDNSQELYMRKKIKDQIIRDSVISFIIMILSVLNPLDSLGKSFGYGLLIVFSITLLINIFFYMINKDAFDNVNKEIKPINPLFTNFTFLLIGVAGLLLGSSILKLEERGVGVVIFSIVNLFITLSIYGFIYKKMKDKIQNENMAVLATSAISFVFYIILAVIAFMVYFRIFMEH